MHKLFEEIRANWPKILVQMLVLVSGITISFLLNEWRTSVNNKQIEIRTLEALRENLVADSSLIDLRLTQIGMMSSAYQQLLNPTVGLALPDDSLDMAMDLLNTYTGFSRKDMAYEELQQTGNSRLIQNKELLSRVIDLYHSSYDNLEEWEEINRRFILDRMLPFLDMEAPFAGGSTAYGNMQGMRPVYSALVEDDRFMNLVKTNLLFKKAQHTIFGLTKKEVVEVIAAIDKELEHLR